MWPFPISPEAAGEVTRREGFAQKGVNSEKMRSILKTDRFVALRLICTSRAADGEGRISDNLKKIKGEEGRIKQSQDDIKATISGWANP